MGRPPPPPPGPNPVKPEAVLSLLSPPGGAKDLNISSLAKVTRASSKSPQVVVVVSSWNASGGRCVSRKVFPPRLVSPLSRAGTPEGRSS